MNAVLNQGIFENLSSINSYMKEINAQNCDDFIHTFVEAENGEDFILTLIAGFEKT